jgi:hypothetical protein
MISDTHPSTLEASIGIAAELWTERQVDQMIDGVGVHVKLKVG